MNSTLLESDGTTLIRSADGWQVIDMPAELIAPNTDYLSFLKGATQVVALTREGQTGYAFVIDGKILAEQNRDDMQTALEAQGVLPAGTELSTADMLSSMTGTGELWLDADGYPSSLVLDLDQPKATDVYDSRAHVGVQFSDFGAVTSFPTPVKDDAGIWRIESTSLGTNTPATTEWVPIFLRNQALVEFSKRVDLSVVPMILLCLTLAALLVHLNRRFKRLVYTLLVVLVTVSMILTPLLKSINVADFNLRLARAKEQTTAAFNAPYNEAAHTSPLLASGSDDPTMCGDGDPNVDSDGDGLSDRTENCIGTDPQGRG